MRWEPAETLPTVTSNAPPGASSPKEPIMSENLFSAVLSLSLLAGGAVAFGSELVGPHHSAAQVATLPAVTITGKRIAADDAVTLPTVTVTGKRIASEDVVTLPTVVVTGRRAASTRLAAETHDVQQRVQ
jgi:hypothetical protein